MDELTKDLNETENYLEQINRDQEQYNLTRDELDKRVEAIECLKKYPEKYTNAMNEKKNEVQLLRHKLETEKSKLNDQLTSLIDKQLETVEKLRTFQDENILAPLAQWKHNQQLSMNGRPFDNNLDHLARECELYAQQLSKARLQCQQLCEMCKELRSSLFQQAKNEEKKVLGLIEELVKFSFVIETQPFSKFSPNSQVIKTNKLFEVKVRLLFGQSLGVALNPPQVTVSVINEAQARAGIAEPERMGKESSGKIINGKGRMQYKYGQLSLSLKKMKVSKIIRSEKNKKKKKGEDCVTDEKFTLLFQTEFGILGGELKFKLWAMSVPIVVVVHTHQECYAWAKIIWDNQFSQIGRQPFDVPDQVNLGDLLDAINYKFQSELGYYLDQDTGSGGASLGRGLTEEQLKYVAEKLLRARNVQDWRNKVITWDQFVKDKLPSKPDNPSFTFWEWFYYIMKMTSEHMKQMWNLGLITGFIERRLAYQLLSDCQGDRLGTFIIRYGDSSLGVSIAWSGIDQAHNVYGTFSVSPFSIDDLKIRGLANRLSDLTHLKYLFPNRPKDQVFGEFYESNATIINEYYISSELVTVVKGWSERSNGNAIPFNAPAQVHNNPIMVNNHAVNGDMDELMDEEYDDNNSFVSLMNLDSLNVLSEDINISDFDLVQ